MHPLPKTNPVLERIPSSRIVIFDLLDKLVKGCFTGYVSYTAIGIEVSCIFAQGKLICATSTKNQIDTSGLEAVTGLFDQIMSGVGEISIYRMTSEMAMCSHALLRGTKLISGVEVGTTDLKGVLSQLKSSRLNGVVRFSTEEHQAMIFFSDGRPIGFYHDDALTIETSPDESRRIAALPGARLEVSATRPLEELMQFDLLSRLPPGMLGDAVKARMMASETDERHEQGDPIICAPHLEKLAELFEDLQEVAMAYLSREGRLIIVNRLKEAGGLMALLDAEKVESFLRDVEQDALLIDTREHVNEMIDLMKTEITGFQGT